MSINKTFAVFGLGRYGRAVATELVNNGAEVLAVDRNENIINDIAHEIPVCKCADFTDPEVIDQLGISNIDVVIVCTANNLEATVMGITLCKQAGVEMVIAKCVDEMHEQIFARVGADRVLFPERESGRRLARNLLTSGFIDMVEISKDVSIVEIPVKNDWAGKSLVQLDLRKKHNINVVAITDGDNVITSIDPEMPLKTNMQLVVISDTAGLVDLKD